MKPTSSDGFCIETPFGHKVHFYRDMSFTLCPSVDPIGLRYNPCVVAHWLIVEGWDLVFKPDFSWEAVEL